MENDINLTVLGVNYKKTSLEIRNKFALTTPGIKSIYEDENSRLSDDFFILSTCNRTEIYTTSAEPQKLLHIFRQYNHVTETEIKDSTFMKEGDDAIRHLLRVASGVDSQILGDYEIVGQLKKAFNLAKENNKVGGLIEKLINTSLKTSKQIRATTNISDGTTSISYAVVQLLKKEISFNSTQKLCLMGLGKIGSLTLKNLTHYLPGTAITLINRNQTKAETLATDYNVIAAKTKDLSEVLAKSDILIVATGADHSVINKEDIINTPVKLIFDLSVPSNIGKDVREIEGLKVFGIDQLSQIVNETLDKRKNQIPFAEDIIEENIVEYNEWKKRRSEYTTKAKEISVTLENRASE
jgi:glutamyl-tRNA reductase